MARSVVEMPVFDVKGGDVLEVEMFGELMDLEVFDAGPAGYGRWSVTLHAPEGAAVRLAERVIPSGAIVRRVVR